MPKDPYDLGISNEKRNREVFARFNILLFFFCGSILLIVECVSR